MVPLERCFFNGITLVLITQTFKYGYMSKINSGIIASIFSTSVAFTCVLFYIIYKQKLSRYDFLGIALIVACVVMIALGKPESGTG